MVGVVVWAIFKMRPSSKPFLFKLDLGAGEKIMATCFALTPSFKTEALNISQMAFSATWKLMHSISTSFSQCCSYG